MAFLKRTTIKKPRDYQCVAYLAGKKPTYFLGLTRDEALVFRIECERKNFYTEVLQMYDHEGLYSRRAPVT